MKLLVLVLTGTITNGSNRGNRSMMEGKQRRTQRLLESRRDSLCGLGTDSRSELLGIADFSKTVSTLRLPPSCGCAAEEIEPKGAAAPERKGDFSKRMCSDSKTQCLQAGPFALSSNHEHQVEFVKHVCGGSTR